jgi:hypothetical protein
MQRLPNLAFQREQNHSNKIAAANPFIITVHNTTIKQQGIRHTTSNMSYEQWEKKYTTLRAFLENTNQQI